MATPLGQRDSPFDPTPTRPLAQHLSFDPTPTYSQFTFPGSRHTLAEAIKADRRAFGSPSFFQKEGGGATCIIRHAWNVVPLM